MAEPELAPKAEALEERSTTPCYNDHFADGCHRVGARYCSGSSGGCTTCCCVSYIKEHLVVFSLAIDVNIESLRVGIAATNRASIVASRPGSDETAYCHKSKDRSGRLAEILQPRWQGGKDRTERSSKMIQWGWQGWKGI
jgi:hypothetical protein